MKPLMPGLHHVTAITANAQENLDFYTQTLGLRLVKLTVNFDDPGSYHLYYGDGLGSPGTIMTFFAGAGAYQGRSGNGQASVTGFAAAPDSLDFWRRRLKDFREELVFGQPSLRFRDPDGLELQIVEDPQAAPGPDGALRGFSGVSLSLDKAAPSAELLTGVLGFELEERSGGRSRYRAAGAGPAARVDILEGPGSRGTMGAGTVHHVAFRTPDDEHQLLWRKNLQAHGYPVSPVMDRNYFHSIYFREPGGVLFEIATDPPGFTVDQSLEELGRKLVLPAWLEPRREQIQRVLPKLQLPATV